MNIMKNILCIDDIKTNLFTLKSLFDSSKEYFYNIHTATSAQAGFEILLQNKIDLILLDVMMPEVDGLSMAKMIKSNKKLKDIPIIFVTAKTDDKTIQKCYEVGGSDYVSKPYNNIELLTRVDFHLRYKDKEKLLQHQKEFAQNVLDLQDNFILVTDGEVVTSINKAILDFYGLKSLEDFQMRYQCICNTFKEIEGYFHLGLVEDKDEWIDDVIQRMKKDDVIVAIEDKEKHIHHFAVKAKSVYDLYILSLTDVTFMCKKTKKFEHEANFDTLTQIYNRNMFYHLMKKKLKQAKIDKSDICFVIFDIDHFKKVNDTYGHLLGDTVLKNLSLLVSKNIRGDDIFARWGGEEFILALDTDMENAKKVIENLRVLIENEPFEEVGHITCSFGLTNFKENDTIESITSRADEALYEAKESGRNRVCIKL